MFDIGWSEMLIIGVVALVVIGPKELPGALQDVRLLDEAGAQDGARVPDRRRRDDPRRPSWMRPSKAVDLVAGRSVNQMLESRRSDRRSEEGAERGRASKKSDDPSLPHAATRLPRSGNAQRPAPRPAAASRSGEAPACRTGCRARCAGEERIAHGQDEDPTKIRTRPRRCRCSIT